MDDAMRDMSGCSEGVFSELKKSFSGSEFDCAVMVTYNSETHLISNSWTFQGHPGEWGKQQLCEVAQQITAAAAECMKADVNLPENREVRKKVEPVTLAKTFTNKTGGKLLFGIGFRILNPYKPLWFYLYKPSYPALGAWADTDKMSNGTRYWKVVLNFLFFTIMICKDI
jgi:hypothetical protein